MARLQEPLNVRVSPKVLEEIDAAAARRGMLRTEWVTQWLAHGLAVDKQQWQRQESVAGYGGVPEL